MPMHSNDMIAVDPTHDPVRVLKGPLARFGTFAGLTAAAFDFLLSFLLAPALRRVFDLLHGGLPVTAVQRPFQSQDLAYMSHEQSFRGHRTPWA
jgi:hypothetical protein